MPPDPTPANVPIPPMKREDFERALREGMKKGPMPKAEPKRKAPKR